MDILPSHDEQLVHLRDNIHPVVNTRLPTITSIISSKQNPRIMNEDIIVVAN